MTQKQYIEVIIKQTETQRDSLNQMENILIDKFMEAVKVYGRATAISVSNHEAVTLQMRAVSAMSQAATAIVDIEGRQDIISQQLASMQRSMVTAPDTEIPGTPPAHEEAGMPPSEPSEDNVVQGDFSNTRESVSYGDEG